MDYSIVFDQDEFTKSLDRFKEGIKHENSVAAARRVETILAYGKNHQTANTQLSNLWIILNSMILNPFLIKFSSNNSYMVIGDFDVDSTLNGLKNSLKDGKKVK